MAVAKKRTTKAHQQKRRLNIFITEPHLDKCQKCGHFTMPHKVCTNCGYYNGREVINVMEKLTKKERKKKEKEMEAKKEEKPLNPKELSQPKP